MRIVSLFIILVLSFIAFLPEIIQPPLCFAATLHVSPDGVDNPTCGSITFPCRKIFIATENAGPGDHIIRVATGNYGEQAVIAPFADSLSIEGGWDLTFNDHSCNPAATTFKGLISNLRSGNAQNIELSCMRFAGNSGAGISLSGSDTMTTIAYDIHDCIIESNGSGISLISRDDAVVTFSLEDSIVSNNSGSLKGGLHIDVYGKGRADVLLHRNIITKNVSSNSGGGVALTVTNMGRYSATLTNNIIAENRSPGGGGIYFYTGNTASTNKTSLINNTIVNNTSTGYGGGIAIFASTIYCKVTLKNTIVWGNESLLNKGDDIYLEESSYYPGSQSWLNIDYSVVGDIYVDNPLFPYIDGGHNLTVNPKLTADYHLKSSSPAIDSGQCGYKVLRYIRVAPYDDFESDLRPGFGQLIGCDIGADEYNSLLCFPVKNQQGKINMICF